ncbi:MAG: hypothetical protein D6681_20170 [Calditrichaeota bacterium]|nr:MAG: hypothetical protein D6681_20170 [Calditrichota bacterium]
MKINMIRNNGRREASVEDAASRIRTERKNGRGMVEIAITERRQIQRTISGDGEHPSQEKRDAALRHFVSGIPESYLRSTSGRSGFNPEKRNAASQQAAPFPGSTDPHPPEKKAVRSGDGGNASPEEELAKAVSRKIGENPAGLLPDVRDLLSPRQGELFIRKLFRNDATMFQNFMNMLAHVATWPDASRLIDEFFYRHGIDPYSREALELTNVVYTRYFPKERSLYPDAKFKS